MPRRSVLFGGLAALIASLAAPAWGDTLYLRQNCAEAPAGAFCDTALVDVLTELGTRTPSATNPLVVDIGEGTFSITGPTTTPLYCSGKSYVTFRGTGSRTTILTGGAYASGARSYVVKVSACSHLAFQDLAIRSDITATVPTDSGVLYTGNTGAGASTTWTNVAITAQRIGFRNESATAVDASVHYWYDGRIDVAEEASPPTSAPSLYALQANGATYRIIGTELKAKGGVPRAVYVAAAHAISLTAATIEATTTREATAWAITTVAPCVSGSILTVQGSDVTSAAATGQRAFGAAIGCGDTTIHGTRFDVRGTYRVRLYASAGTVDAPYSLGSGTTPPTLDTGATFPWSPPGQDHFVETDCEATCGGPDPGTEQHLLVFNASRCPTAGWYDTNVGDCR